MARGKIIEINRFVINRYHIYSNENKNMNIEKILVTIKEELLKGYSLKDICKKIKISDFFIGHDLKNDTIFPCLLRKGNFAWISCHNDKERYFSKIHKGYTFAFDVIDLLCVYLNKNYIELLKYLKETLGIDRDFDDTDFKEKEKRKYKEIINTIPLINKIDYPYLYKLIGKKFNVLEGLCYVGIDNIGNDNFSLNDNSIFFVSIRYLKENYIKDEAISSISSIINIFYCIGLIKKYSIEELPEKYKEYSLKMKDDNKKHINYFSLRDIDNFLLIEANKRAKKLLDNGIRFSNFSKRKIKNIFEDIYIQNDFDFNKISKLKKNEDLFENSFYYRYENLGYVSLNEMRKEFSFLSNRCFFDLWKSILNKNSYKTSRMKKGEELVRGVVVKNENFNVEEGLDVLEFLEIE